MGQVFTVFVNEHPVSVSPGANVLEAVRVLDGDLADALSSGAAYTTDGVGRPIDATRDVAVGDIVRVVVSARRAGRGEPESGTGSED
jgi:hypothetical protein